MNTLELSSVLYEDHDTIRYTLLDLAQLNNEDLSKQLKIIDNIIVIEIPDKYVKLLRLKYDNEYLVKKILPNKEVFYTIKELSNRLNLSILELRNLLIQSKVVRINHLNELIPVLKLLKKITVHNYYTQKNYLSKGKNYE
jgi:hypothetical protein